jgi:hypothetical protein
MQMMVVFFVQDKVLKKDIHILHQLCCSAATMDPCCMSLQGIIEGNARKEIVSMDRKVEATNKKVAHLIRRIHHGNNEPVCVFLR